MPVFIQFNIYADIVLAMSHEVILPVFREVFKGHSSHSGILASPKKESAAALQALPQK